jgi:hypothetical protein
MFPELNDQQLRKLARDGAYVAEILADERFLAVVRNVRDGYHRRWETSPLEDQAGRERLFAQVRALDDLMRELRAAADAGLAAQKALVERERR